MVVPIGNVAGALFDTEATPQLSDVTGVPKTTLDAKQLLLLVFRLRLAGAMIFGSWLSVTVTVNEHCALPQELLAVTITLVTPVLKVEPLPLPDPLPVVAPVNV
jgi:hypothetical protein